MLVSTKSMYLGLKKCVYLSYVVHGKTSVTLLLAPPFSFVPLPLSLLPVFHSLCTLSLV